MNAANDKNPKSIKNSFRVPVRVACGIFIGCVLYLSTQAYLAFPTYDSQVQSSAIEPQDEEAPALPQVHYDHPRPPQVVSHQIERGDTLGRILTASAVAAQDINRVTTCRSECRKLHDLQPGTFINLRLDQNGRLLTIGQTLALGQTRQFHFYWDRIDVVESQLDRQTVKAYNHVVIHSGESPISAAQRNGGIKEATVVRATQILEYDIDFWRNIYPNDEFDIYYEQIYINDEYVDDGNIYALRFINRGKVFEAYLHSDGKHYEADGSAFQKQFLKAPLRYKRISSSFSNARKHPILGYTRAHKGVDYAAPRGTPIRSTADGVVTRVTRNDAAAGNFLQITHGNGFETRYLHLNGFARGIARGTSVSRGSTIGYVGSTGYSTGPHLHYEVIKDDRHVNPLSVVNPSVEGLKGLQYDRFFASVSAYRRTMEKQKGNQQVAESVAVAE